MVYWTIVQRSHGIYDIVQYGALPDGKVYGLTIVAQDGMCDSHARDVAQHAHYVIQSRTKLPLEKRFQEANRTIESRYEQHRHAISFGRFRAQFV